MKIARGLQDIKNAIRQKLSSDDPRYDSSILLKRIFSAKLSTDFKTNRVIHLSNGVTSEQIPT